MKKQISQIFIFFCLLTALSVYGCTPESLKQEGFHLSISTNSSCRQDCCSNLESRQPMAYYYYQNTGKFRGGSGQYAINTMGYSGQGKGYLNPDYQCKSQSPDAGPLPASTYQVAFCKNMMHQVTNRPCSFYLKPLKPFEVCGRDDFFIHGCQCCTNGDDTEPPSAGCSAGCIVISYKDRKKIRIGDTIIVQSYEPKGQEQNQIKMKQE